MKHFCKLYISFLFAFFPLPLVLCLSQVDHLEPWEKNSRKLAGQVGMCAGVSVHYLENIPCLCRPHHLHQSFVTLPRTQILETSLLLCTGLQVKFHSPRVLSSISRQVKFFFFFCRFLSMKGEWRDGVVITICTRTHPPLPLVLPCLCLL